MRHYRGPIFLPQVANAIGSGDLRTAPQLALFAAYRYHGCITDRDGDNTLELEADHRRHAEIEKVIRDPASSAGQALKYGAGLNHLPSGRFPANGAWLAIQVMAQNVARWAARRQRASVWAINRRPPRPAPGGSSPVMGDVGTPFSAP